GVDDNNTSTLGPDPAQFITQSSFLVNAAAFSGFNTDKWIFQKAEKPIPERDLKVAPYSAWVVTHDKVTDPGGNVKVVDVVNKDAGGANFGLTYTPRPNSDDPPEDKITFLQVLHRY